MLMKITRHNFWKKYEVTYYPERMVDAGKAAYIERNYEMIDNSSFCVIYYDESYKPPKSKSNCNNLADYQPKSGTRLAYDYAQSKNVKIINILNGTI